MKTGRCRCHNRIFFNNFRCLACSAVLGRCNECSALTSFSELENGLDCDNCGATVTACINSIHAVCRSYNSAPQSLCRWCSFTRLLPDLERPESVHRWAIAEAAKRRLLLQLEDLQMPPFLQDLQQTHPLSFAFQEDRVDEQGNTVAVLTGHQNGLITINLAESDSVHRERQRVQFREPQRTLIGHLRHEIGHYVDWCWASRVALSDYKLLFGDPEAVDYSQALQRHYEQGPSADWEHRFVSAYATMHPWEDFAETVNAYLDIMAIAATALDQGRTGVDLSPTADASQLVENVLEIVVEVSEYNFDLGLLPLLPERLSPAVVEKLTYVHSLRSKVLGPHENEVQT